MSTVAFAPLTAAENAFYTIVWQPMVKAGEMWLGGQVPFFALPVVSSLEQDAVDALSDALYHWLCTQVDMAAIVLVDAEKQSLWASISEKLAIIASEQGETSDAYKQALMQNAAAFAAFVHTGP